MATKPAKIEINVYYGPLPHHFDFGLFPSAKKIWVTQEFWNKYLEARKQFEFLHTDLIDKARAAFGPHPHTTPAKCACEGKHPIWKWHSEFECSNGEIGIMKAGKFDES